RLGSLNACIGGTRSRSPVPRDTNWSAQPRGSRLWSDLQKQMPLELCRQFRYSIRRSFYQAEVLSLAVIGYAMLAGLQSAQFDFAFPVGRGEERVIHFAVFRDGI